MNPMAKAKWLQEMRFALLFHGQRVMNPIAKARDLQEQLQAST